ncbi:hypothetical protein H2200_006509 [Cladophialophora chaetospira]|uniref:Methyltransferase type 11 domain-containing protein n=1 Tax=Cladophialophora chaetospira TaxID=386627 RepID=A0AA38X8C1_9EURO|nr:hypothetical protein H2200_006509 [Cladophialophora chaetospira]
MSPSIYELGVNFFFTKYSFSEEPFFNGYHAWLAESYRRADENNVLPALIEAVGLAGLSNVSYAVDLESKSKERYCSALNTLKEVVNDPVLAPEDTTLMAVILLILFEIVTFKTWDRYHCWVAHVRAATALLELRGKAQFDRERAGQLYVQSRSHILLACMQQYTSVPYGLVQSTYGFQSSPTRQQWQKRKIASPGSISEISFRTINLRAALKNRELTDPAIIRATALAIDADIASWRAALPPSWGYITTDKLKDAPGSFNPESSHIYTNNWIADAWNNWRTLRIIVKQIILENEICSMTPDPAQISTAEAVIRQMSIDICVSIHSFRDNPRILAMIQPLYFVALTELNTSTIIMTAAGAASAPFTNEKTFSAYNQDQGKNYAQVRRNYHPKVFQTVVDHHVSTGGQLDTVLDVGCGPGNVAGSLAPHFKHAIGLDPSEGMLATARSFNAKNLTAASEPIRFELSTAEELGTKLATSPLQDSSVDLIVAGNAAHWFDMAGFWPTAARVLKPGGTVALWTSGPVQAHPSLPNAKAIQATLDEHRSKHLTPYVTPGNLLARDRYINLPLPWTLPEPVPEFDETTYRRIEWDLAEPFHTGKDEADLDTFEKMLATGSPETRWRQAHPEDVGTERDILKIMRKEIERLLHEAGVEKGKERVKGAVQGAILLVKKKA